MSANVLRNSSVDERVRSLIQIVDNNKRFWLKLEMLYDVAEWVLRNLKRQSMRKKPRHILSVYGSLARDEKAPIVKAFAHIIVVHDGERDGRFTDTACASQSNASRLAAKDECH